MRMNKIIAIMAIVALTACSKNDVVAKDNAAPQVATKQNVVKKIAWTPIERTEKKQFQAPGTEKACRETAIKYLRRAIRVDNPEDYWTLLEKANTCCSELRDRYGKNAKYANQVFVLFNASRDYTLMLKEQNLILLPRQDGTYDSSHWEEGVHKCNTVIVRTRGRHLIHKVAQRQKRLFSETWEELTEIGKIAARDLHGQCIGDTVFDQDKLFWAALDASSPSKWVKKSKMKSMLKEIKTKYRLAKKCMRVYRKYYSQPRLKRAVTSLISIKLRGMIVGTAVRLRTVGHLLEDRIEARKDAFIYYKDVLAQRATARTKTAQLLKELNTGRVRDARQYAYKIEMTWCISKYAKKHKNKSLRKQTKNLLSHLGKVHQNFYALDYDKEIGLIKRPAQKQRDLHSSLSEETDQMKSSNRFGDVEDVMGDLQSYLNGLLSRTS